MTKIISFYNKYQYIIWLVAAFLIGLIPILWFKGHMIAGEEFYALDYAKWGKMFEDSWFTRVNFGEYSPLTPFKFQQLFFEFLYVIGFNHYLALVTWTVLLNVIQSATFYLFLYTVFKKEKNPIFYFICTFFYLFNPYFLNISPYLTPARILFSILPTLFILFYKIYEDFSKVFSYLFLINFVLFIASPLFVNIPAGLVLVALVFAYLIFIFALLKVPLVKSLYLLGAMLLTYVVLNVWWIVPTGYKQLSATTSLKTEAGSFITIDQSRIADVLSLFGSWAFREPVIDTKFFYFPYYARFDSFLGALFRYIPYLLIILSIFYYRDLKGLNRKKTYFIFSIYFIYFIFLFLSKGTSDPFGALYTFLYKHFPLFWMFREPYAKFLPFAVFAESFLLLLGLDYVFSLLKLVKNTKLKISSVVLFYAITFTTIVFLAYPFISGEVIWNINDGKMRSHIVEIPEGWKQLIKEWTPKKGYYYLLMSQTFYDRYVWPSGYSGNPYLMLTDANTLNPHKGYSESDNVDRRRIIGYLLRTIISDPSRLKNECLRYNLSGFILQKDLSPQDYGFYADALKNIFRDYSANIVFNNQNATIFECSAQNDKKIEILGQNSYLDINSQDINFYHIFKPALSALPLFNITDTTSSALTSFDKIDKEGNDLIYDISTVSKESSIYIYRSLDNIKNIKIDDSYINYQSKGDYIILDLSKLTGQKDCCKTLTISVKNADDLTTNQANPWQRMPIINTVYTELKDIKPTELYLDNKYIYITKLAKFDPIANQFITFQLGQPYSGLPFGASIIQRNIKNDSLRYIASFNFVSDLKTPVALPYKGETSDFIDLFDNSEFYLGIYGSTKIDGLSETDKKSITNMPLNPSPITVTKQSFPFVFALKNATISSTRASITDYKEIGTSIILFNSHSEKDDPALVHFLNSYHASWRLLTLDKKNYEHYTKSGVNLIDNIILLNSAKMAAQPMNIEYYSNGWNTDLKSGENYYMLVFWPSLMAKILYSFSITSLVVMVSISLYLRKIKK